MLKWIWAYLFDCVHFHTSWPHRNQLGHAYVCCLDCGKEMQYSLEYMRIVREERKQDGWASRSSVVRQSRRPSFRAIALCAGLLAVLVLPGAATPIKLKPETLAAWQEYIEAARVRMQGSLKAGGSFLLSDSDSARAAKLRAGEIIVAPVGPHIPQSVPSGLIHDWAAEAFIPNVSIEDILLVVRDYEHYKQIYTPAVINSEAIVLGESADQFSLVLMNRSLIAKTALDGTFQSNFFRVNEQRWYSVSETTRMQEITGYGTDSQRSLPEGEGTGLIWRTFVTTRFEERDGGVYIEMETIALSRDIPISLRWMVNPIVRRISRSALETSLSQTRVAVKSAVKGKHETLAQARPNLPR